MIGSPHRRRIAAGAVAVALVAGACSEGSREDLEAGLGRSEPASTSTTRAESTSSTSSSTTSTTSTTTTTTSTTTTTTTTTTPSTTTGGSGSVSVFDLEVGLCFDDPQGTQVETVPSVPCDQPHDNEVFHLFDLADGPYPGDDTVELAAQEGCAAAFETFVARDYATSALFLVYLTPTTQTWAEGDREVVCFLYLPDEKLTGSMRGSGI